MAHPPHTPPHYKDAAVVPDDVQDALRQAMQLEEVAEEEFDDLLWVMAQESEGRVDARNPHSTARGLYQLLQAQYHLNPNGAHSFGNAVEEFQGGIRYIVGRYKTGKAAKAFWQTHHWY